MNMKKNQNVIGSNEKSYLDDEGKRTEEGNDAQSFDPRKVGEKWRAFCVIIIVPCERL